MPSICLNDHIDIMSRNEPRSQADNQLRIPHRRSNVLLGQYSIHHNVDWELCQHLPCWIYRDSNGSVLPTSLDLIDILAENGLDVFHIMRTIVNSFAE